MNFKKDYLNFVLQNIIAFQPGYSALNVTGSNAVYPANEYIHVKKILEHIIKSDDFVKTTFLIGKTAGLELLFKYMLYISDKIDKSQVTIFNIKDNFDYDVQNLKRICEKIDSHYTNTAANQIENSDLKEPGKKISTSKIKIDLNSEKEISSVKEEEQTDESAYESEVTDDGGMTLIENRDTGKQDEEIFEVADIDEPESEKEETSVIDKNNENDEILLEQEIKEKEIEEITGTKTADAYSNLEFEVNEPVYGEEGNDESRHIKEESVTNEAYLKFENKFFEDVKILEKLFYYVGKMSRQNSITKLSDRMLQSITEIIEISSELSDLTRQLSFDLTADIFFTINLYFTKTIKNPLLLTYDRIYLLESSLKLVNSLIKGENYLNYDEIVEQIENLKNELAHPAEKKHTAQNLKKPEAKAEEELRISESKRPDKEKEEIQKKIDMVNYEARKEAEKYKMEGLANKDDIGEAVFKIKYFVKEFEKTFLSVDNITGEYSKFEALEKIDEMNNLLRLIAKISASVKLNDVLKLSEVSYVFLKYLKDYRMDLLDPEIHRIIKYIISTFKMLLTEQKTEDFNKLVQYLNNPVKIFTDSN